MMADYAKLLCRSAIALTLCLVAILFCYYWIDRPVAFFVHRHGLDHITIFHWLTYPPPLVQTWSPLILAVLLIRRAFGPWLRWESILLVACLSLLVADQFRIGLGDICGRYWPETWYRNNPSLIGTGAYGFHPFQRGDDLGSFPSGHASRVVSFASVWLILEPRSRGVVTLLAFPMLVSLVATDYHFVSDVIAGSVLGTIIAAYGTCLARLEPSSDKTCAISAKAHPVNL